MLFDVFAKYRTDDRNIQMSSSNHYGVYIPKTTKQFCNETIINQLAKNARNDIAIALTSYEFRFLPAFKFQPPAIYNDTCEAFIEYTIMVSHAIRGVIQTSKTLTVPMQVTTTLEQFRVPFVSRL